MKVQASQLSAVGQWTVIGSAALVAMAAFLIAPHIVPVLDAVDAVLEPLVRHGGDYLGWSSDRDFFRPIEYYLNLGAYELRAAWLTLTVVVLLIAATSVALSWLAHPDGDRSSRDWRWITAAILFVHPIILASEFEYDRVSQASANLIGVLSLICATRWPRSVLLLLALHVVGLASKESYAMFLVASSGLAAWTLWRTGRRWRLIWLVAGCGVLAIAYRWIHMAGSNEAMLAATPRYQLHVGMNVLRNSGLFLAGTVFLGSTARAAEEMSWSVVGCALASLVLWTAWSFQVVRAARKASGKLREFTRGLAPLFLGLGASLVPTIFTADVSENNASGFASFTMALTMVLLRRSTVNAQAGEHEHPSVPAGVAIGVAIACICSATGSIDKLNRIRATSADSNFMTAQALSRAGQGGIHVDCRYVPRRRYSIYHMPSAVLVGSINRYLVARGELAVGDVVSCVRPKG
jgi:hypothetical protein